MDDYSRRNLVTWLLISYILLIFFPLASIIMAYVKQGEASGDMVLASHIRGQIKIFWILFFGSILCYVLTLIVIGMFMLLILYIWLIYRVIKGISWLQSNTASTF